MILTYKTKLKVHQAPTKGARSEQEWSTKLLFANQRAPPKQIWLFLARCLNVEIVLIPTWQAIQISFIESGTDSYVPFEFERENRTTQKDLYMKCSSRNTAITS